MKTGILCLLGMLLLFSPALARAQTPTVTPTTTSTFSSTPTVMATVTPTSSVQATTTSPALATPMTTATATPTEEKSLADKIMDLQTEITDLSDQRSDTDLQYRHLERVYLEELMRSQAKAARAGNAKKAREIQKQITGLEALRDSEWDQDAVLLEKRSQLKQLQIDRSKEINKMLLEKARETGTTKRVEELEEGKRVVAQMKDLETQELDMAKQLMQARRNYDFKAAAGLRLKLRDLQKKYRDLLKNATDKLKQIQGTREPEEFSL